jgi:hypothetical protein
MSLTFAKFSGPAACLMTIILVSPSGAADNSTAIPNLSGLWGRNSLYFEPPESGPGPVPSVRRRRVVGAGFERINDYTSPLLKPEAAELLKKRGESLLTGVGFPTPHDQCRVEATPYVLAVQFEMQILQQRDRIIFIYLAGPQVRHVRLNDEHPARVLPSWSGDSVGHYEGDMLVIDTVGIKAGPLSMLDWLGTPHSSALHVIERYRLIDGEAAKRAVELHEKGGRIAPELAYGVSPDPDSKGKGLRVRLTVDDPGVFTTPWSAQVTYRRPVGGFGEVICAETALTPYKNAIPTALQSDF